MNWLSRLGIKGKMILGILTFIAVNACISVFGVNGLNQVVANFTHITAINFPNADLISSMEVAQKNIMINLQEFEDASINSQEQQILGKNIEEAMKAYAVADKGYNDVPFVDGEAEIYNPVAASWKEFSAETESYMKAKTAGSKEADIHLKKIFSLTEAFAKNINALSDFQSDQAKKWTTKATDVAKSTLLFQTILVCASALLSLLLGFWFATSLTKKLNSVVVSISESSRQVGSAAVEIAQASQQLSQATTEQAASLEETSSALEETSAMVNKNSDNAKNAATNSIDCQDKAEQGKKVVEKMIESMDQINASNTNIMDQINHSNKQISEIVAVIQEIGNKTKVINEIVFQTKLLSFNASVEAARAGENGKGFAVVAEEVGNLAQMSGNASKEITTLLEGSIHKVEAIVNETKTKVEGLISDGRSKVETGIEIAKQCGDVLNDIVNNVSIVSNMAGEISSACHDQSIGVQEITKAINQLDQVTQQNASSSEQTANSAEGLTAQTESLNAAISVLVNAVQGAGSSVDQPVVEEKKNRFESKKSIPKVATKPSTNNVVALKKPAPKVTKTLKTDSSTDMPTFKSASGDAAPSHTHPGFKDV